MLLCISASCARLLSFCSFDSSSFAHLRWSPVSSCVREHVVFCFKWPTKAFLLVSQFILRTLIHPLDRLHHESLITKHLFVAFFLAVVCNIRRFLCHCSYNDI